MGKNTYIEIECKDGHKIKLTLAFYRLYQLRNKNKHIYEKCNKFLTKGTSDAIETLELLYAAYLCANVDNPEENMDFETFMQEIPNDWSMVSETASELISPRKN